MLFNEQFAIWGSIVSHVASMVNATHLVLTNQITFAGVQNVGALDMLMHEVLDKGISISLFTFTVEIQIAHSMYLKNVNHPL